jgi:hypothetical protein
VFSFYFPDELDNDQEHSVEEKHLPLRQVCYDCLIKVGERWKATGAHGFCKTVLREDSDAHS